VGRYVGYAHATEEDLNVAKIRSRQTESLDAAHGRMHVKTEAVVVELDVRVAEEQAWRS
jgi:hypothetical protein